MIKVLFISPYYPPYIYGGAELSTSMLIAKIRKQFSCTVLTSKVNTEAWIQDNVLVTPLLKIISLGDKSFLALMKYAVKILFFPWVNGWKLHKYLKEHRPDVIHLVPNGSQFVGVLCVAWLKKIPVLIDIRDFTWVCMTDFSFGAKNQNIYINHSCFSHLNSSYSTSISALKPFLSLVALYELLIFSIHIRMIRFFFNTSTSMELSAISHYTKDRLIEAGFNPKKMTVISNILSENMSLTQKRQKVFVFAGRVEESKGIWELLAAFGKTNPPGFTLEIFGDGSQLIQVQEHVQTQKLRNIIIHGRQPLEKIIKTYQSSYCIIAPANRPEPLGRYILDSFATSTPLITTNNGAQKEFITDHVNGLLIDPNNVAQLSHAIQQIVTDQKLYINIVKNLTKIPDSLKTKHIVRQRSDLYKKLYFAEIKR